MRDHTGLNGTKNGNGWEKCSQPISNDEVWGSFDYDELDNLLAGISGEYDRCPSCRDFSRMILGTLGNIEWSKCRACGMVFADDEPMEDK